MNTMNRYAITPARDYSSRNRKRHTAAKRRALFATVILFSVLFWAGVMAALIS